MFLNNLFINTNKEKIILISSYLFLQQDSKYIYYIYKIEK